MAKKVKEETLNLDNILFKCRDILRQAKNSSYEREPNTEMPSFVYRDGMTADKEYVEWLSDLKRRNKQSQLRTAVKANSEVLEYYWNLGRDIVAKEAESKWGVCSY